MPVLLYRFAKHCPICQAPQVPYTSKRGNTRITPSCDPMRCRIARTFALAASPRPAGFELLPEDDRHSSKRTLLGAHR